MSNKEEFETERVHLVLFKEDMDYLRQNYGPGSALSHIGISKAVRIIVQQRVRGLKAKEISARDGMEQTNGK